MKQDAQLTLSDTDNTINLPVLAGTLGPKVIDVSALVKQGYFTFDPGFRSTAACQSDITFIDGASGTLLHRGYPIEELAEKSNYLEVCYLLLNGELPNEDEMAAFTNKIKSHTLVHESLSNFFNGFRRDAHPMAIMVGVVVG